jgi:hypothetical protein
MKRGLAPYKARYTRGSARLTAPGGSLCVHDPVGVTASGTKRRVRTQTIDAYRWRGRGPSDCVPEDRPERVAERCNRLGYTWSSSLEITWPTRKGG